MKWFRRRQRRPRMAPFDASKLPPRQQITVEAAVAEGVMLAEYAARLRLRNAIVIGAVGRSVDYDSRLYLTEARAVMSSLAAEADAAANRIREEREEAEVLSGRAGHAHDYRAGDTKNLRHRERVSRELASRLRGFRDDDEYLLALIEKSRDEAWRDISRTLEESLKRADVASDPLYEQERDARLKELVENDLANLIRERELAELRSELSDEWGQ